MRNSEIIKRCVETLKMTQAEAEWVAEHLYDYVVPDFSEWSWAQIDQSFRDVLWFRGKTEKQITEFLCVS